MLNQAEHDKHDDRLYVIRHLMAMASLASVLSGRWFSLPLGNRYSGLVPTGRRRFRLGHLSRTANVNSIPVGPRPDLAHSGVVSIAVFVRFHLKIYGDGIYFWRNRKQTQPTSMGIPGALSHLWGASSCCRPRRVNPPFGNCFRRQTSSTVPAVHQRQ
jgi:hypothetical protein